MALTTKIKRSHSGVWTFLPSDLPGGGTLTISTGIRLARKGANYNFALDQCRAIYKETSSVGSPAVPDPELTAVNGHLVVTITNVAGVANQSGGEVTVEYLHSSRR